MVSVTRARVAPFITHRSTKYRSHIVLRVCKKCPGRLPNIQFVSHAGMRIRKFKPTVSQYGLSKDLSMLL